MIKTNMSDFNPEKEQLNKIYRGVIEDNNDPLKMGCCRIRVWGIHTEAKEPTPTNGIPTEELPWAEPAMGLFEGSISGFGAWCVPLQGSHVFLFFEAGNILQPRYFATVPGITKEKPNSNNGFSDPSDTYPTDTRLGESDFHRLSRGESTKTIVDHKNNNLDEDIVKADGKTWNEPKSAYAAEYPHNIVFTTHSGITIELDNTPAEERIHIFHPSNSYVEIDNKGNTVIKSANDKYEIVMGEKNIHIKSDLNTTISGNKTEYIEGNRIVKIDGDHDETIGKNKTENIALNKTETIGANKTENIALNKTETIGVNKTENIVLNKTVTIGANKTESTILNKIETVGINKTETVIGIKAETSGIKIETVLGAKTENIILNKSETVGVDKTETVFGIKTETVGVDKTETVVGIKTETSGIKIETVLGAKTETVIGAYKITAPIIYLN